MSDNKNYYPEFFDPANIVEPYLDPPSDSIWDRFINDPDSEIDNVFAEFLWVRLQDACDDIDEIYDELAGGVIKKKDYDEIRKVFEAYFAELERICTVEVFNTSPFEIDALVWNESLSKKIALNYCYGLYCIDRGLRAYFLNDAAFSSRSIAYGLSAIDAAANIKFLSLYDGQVLKENSSKAGKARAARYQPLKDLSFKLVRSRNWKSRRNAVQTIKPEILNMAKSLKIPLSVEQAEITITGWLKIEGLPVKV